MKCSLGEEFFLSSLANPLFYSAALLQHNWFMLTYFICMASRPTALHDRTRESDEEDVHDRDYDVAALANNLSQAFRYTIYDNDDAEEVNFILCWR